MEPFLFIIKEYGPWAFGWLAAGILYMDNRQLRSKLISIIEENTRSVEKMENIVDVLNGLLNEILRRSDSPCAPNSAPNTRAKVRGT
jgi:hypothetical protein